MDVLITAGGTQEPIDDVRFITNLSTGRLGAHLANWLCQHRDVQVTLLSGPALSAKPHWVDASVSLVPFTSTVDLQGKLQEQIRVRKPQLVFMAAAVADYSPIPVQGKRPSGAEQWTLTMRRNEKLLDQLRCWCGADTVLCGFKLMSSASEPELIDTARAQIARAELDLCVANDLQYIVDGAHPVWLVSAQGEPEHVAGTKAASAARIGQLGLDLVSRRISNSKKRS
ncbi:MAG TPA: hypothetical protein DCQ06_00590 [Myxococcales bacterium]|nr:hypothetical protein [Myxococcales bacterium]HAN30069.1 hypothetical protein [Myxococcales bacterium]